MKSMASRPLAVLPNGRVVTESDVDALLTKAGRGLALATAMGLVFIAGACAVALLTNGDPIAFLFGVGFLLLAGVIAWKS